MTLNGLLDIQMLARAPHSWSKPASAGLHIEDSTRLAVNHDSGRCRIEIGALDEDRGRLPLASIARDGDRFVLTVPSYSFLSLFFTRIGENLHWSTSIGQLSTGLGIAQRNRSYERFGLKYQFWPGSETVFAQIGKINPGQRLIVDRTGHQIESLPPPRNEFQALDPADDVALKRAIHETLLNAVEQLSPSNEAVGVMLGGFDSALIVGLLSELGRTTHAVTLQYDSNKYNQRNISQVVKRFGIQHDWVHIDSNLIRDGLLQYGDLFDQPVTQPHYLISGLRLAKVLADKGVLRVLTGDGCDGLFFGYPTVFKKAKLVRALHHLPIPVKRCLRWLVGSRSAERMAGQPARLARQLLETSCRPDELHFFLTSIAVDDQSADLALGKKTERDFFELSVLEALHKTATAGGDWIETTYLSKNMVGLNRAKLSSIWNHSGVEKIYSPYMMPSVAAMAKSIPKSYWISDETPSGKFLLARMAVEHGLLNEEITYQPKMSPVSSPAEQWLRHDLRDDIERMIEKSSLLRNDYCSDLLRERRMEEWYKRIVTIDDYSSQALCMLLSYSRMLENRTGR